MRHVVRLSVATLVALTTGVLTVSVASAEPTTSIDVTYGSPNPGGVPVVVAGTGFVPGAFLRLLQCGPALGLEPDLSTAVNECDLTPFVTPTVDAQGNVPPTPFVVSPTVLGNDCTVVQCYLLLGQLAGPDGFLSAVAPIRFGPPTPATKGECKDGGWRSLANDEGQPFRNQGQCVSHVTRRR
jgi:hypothetical protein